MSEILYDYFREQVTSTIQDLNVDVPVETQLYVAQLLSRYARSEKLFVAMEGRLELEPMAFMLRRALEQEEAERIRILREMGDQALYTSGFFADRLERRGMEIDYYIHMGGQAYSNLASLCQPRGGSAFSGLYEALSHCFRDLVRVLWELADRTQMVTQRGLLALYKKWEETGAERYQRKLMESGFVLSTSPAKILEC